MAALDAKAICNAGLKGRYTRGVPTHHDFANKITGTAFRIALYPASE